MMFLASPEKLPETGEYAFRYHDSTRTNGYFDDGDYGSGDFVATGGVTTSLHLCSYRVLRHTKCGFWIEDGGERFVNLSWTKRFAHITRADALASYIARKDRQMRILHRQLDAAEQGRALAKQLQQTRLLKQEDAA